MAYEESWGGDYGSVWTASYGGPATMGSSTLTAWNPHTLSEMECAQLLNDNKPMNYLTALGKRLLSKELQTLVKAGYLNSDLGMTDKGKCALLALLFEKHQAELVTLAEAELEEKKK